MKKPPRARSRTPVSRTEGHVVRLVLQSYRPDKVGYRETGLSMARIRVANSAELTRLWDRLQEVVEDRQWTDRVVTAPRETAASRSADPV